MQENQIAHVFRNFPVYERHYPKRTWRLVPELNRKWYPKVNKCGKKVVFEEKVLE